MTCSQTIKACGLKSTQQVADLNGVSKITITRAFNSDREKFNSYVLAALEIFNQDKYEAAENELRGNRDES